MEKLKGRVEGFVKTRLKDASFWLKFAAYALPGAFLLYVLYWNFLPFGYDKTFVINVGAPGDTSGEFHLESSKDLSEPKVAADGTTYRELNGIAYATFEPKAVLRNATLSVSVEGDGVSLIPPHIDFDPTSVNWNYVWDFSKEIPEKGLVSSAIYDANQKAAYFDGLSQIKVSQSANKFEEGPFTVYAEWMPQDSEDNAQQIVGHYNWELWQNATSVEFRAGRMNDAEGPAYSIKYPIVNPDAFFNQKHTVLAVYNPGENGYIELYVDGNFVDRKYIGVDTLWKDYGANKFSLSFGKSEHGIAKYFLGYIYNVQFSNKSTDETKNSINFVTKKDSINNITIVSKEPGFLNKINLYAQQK